MKPDPQNPHFWAKTVGLKSRSLQFQEKKIEPGSLSSDPDIGCAENDFQCKLDHYTNQVHPEREYSFFILGQVENFSLLEDVLTLSFGDWFEKVDRRKKVATSTSSGSVMSPVPALLIPDQDLSASAFFALLPAATQIPPVVAT